MADCYFCAASRSQVNVDMGLSSSNKGHSGAACHAVFRSLEEVVVERSSRVDPSDQMQIIQRCQEYDPDVSRRFSQGSWQYVWCAVNGSLKICRGRTSSRKFRETPHRKAWLSPVLQPIYLSFVCFCGFLGTSPSSDIFAALLSDAALCVGVACPV